MYSISRFNYKTGISGLIFTLALISCSKMVDVGMPPGKILTNQVFATDAMANEGVSGIYSGNGMGVGLLPSSALGAGGATICGGVSADELMMSSTSSDALELSGNSLGGKNYYASALWSSAYSLIYKTNLCIKGLTESRSLSPAVKARLLGECKFLWSFFYFYLVNFYGDVPIVTGTDFQKNAVLPRNPAAEVYDSLIAGLGEARSLLPDAGNDYTRATKYAVTALLARVYLYRGKYADAEKEATSLIESGNFSLETDPANVFLATSREAIWKIETWKGITSEGSAFIPGSSSTSVPAYYLSDDLVSSFSPQDKRIPAWTGTLPVGGKSFYYPAKYRNTYGNFPRNEQYIVLRLAEQYLIRAEARARQHQVQTALQDIDSIRNRAGLDLLSMSNPGIGEAGILAAIGQERRIEFCQEWGHRWLDLKRTPGFSNPSLTRADEVLAPLKPGWKSTSVLFPIPDEERQSNPNLNQNPGY